MFIKIIPVTLADLNPKPVNAAKHHADQKIPAWQQILADSYTRADKLLKDLRIPAQDTSASHLFAVRVPKPFAAKMAMGNINDPLLRQVLPHPDEFTEVDGFSIDPLAEKQFNPVQGLLHKYPSRVLITLRGACAINCRYCFRRHFDYADNRINNAHLQAIIQYIKRQPAVNEVILSGGDPLMATDQHIASLIDQLDTLPQLKRLRIHTRFPIVIPERLTQTLAKTLTDTQLAVVMVLHCNHANEIDDHLTNHLAAFKQANVTLLNQSVLLKGVNDDDTTLVNLSEALFSAGILPYYLFLPDKVAGTAHFDTHAELAKQLVKKMATQLPGYLVPKLARETAGESSKDMWVV